MIFELPGEPSTSSGGATAINSWRLAFDFSRSITQLWNGQLTSPGAGHYLVQNLSWNSVIHCSNRVTIEEMAGLAEQVTVADSSHYFTTPDDHFWHNVRLGEVSIGRNTWICPKVTLARGALGSGRAPHDRGLPCGNRPLRLLPGLAPPQFHTANV